MLDCNAAGAICTVDLACTQWAHDNWKHSRAFDAFVERFPLGGIKTAEDGENHLYTTV
ncbi:hypothetical protein Vi05172_g2191 [Venturia inaequalis]|nr:hypothetical protein Vi05172_g2191 [Venturia inaequalis]